ncbi:hypothetical protein Glove_99g289 [Diversispora epigaea]|uniref:Uncharacterized protein n=1 Tax=Diversispora epigaea TaxID=1348612 RepID=A0A397J4W5_9GLOM|nr:hypothetical protein Glove_99g289 [Diversispora epigaea]
MLKDKKTNEKFNTFASWINFLKSTSILRTKQIPYWKNNNSTNIVEVTSLIKTNIVSKKEFSGVGTRKIINGIGITFFWKRTNH